jgi:hypothetical protein
MLAPRQGPKRSAPSTCDGEVSRTALYCVFQSHSNPITVDTVRLPSALGSWREAKNKSFVPSAVYVARAMRRDPGTTWLVLSRSANFRVIKLQLASAKMSSSVDPGMIFTDVH